MVPLYAVHSACLPACQPASQPARNPERQCGAGIKESMGTTPKGKCEAAGCSPGVPRAFLARSALYCFHKAWELRHLPAIFHGSVRRPCVGVARGGCRDVLRSRETAQNMERFTDLRVILSQGPC